MSALDLAWPARSSNTPVLALLAFSLWVTAALSACGPSGAALPPRPPARAGVDSRIDIDLAPLHGVVPRAEAVHADGTTDGAPAQRTLALDVFAPFATRVAVAGSFNAWSTDAVVLEAGDDGVWRGSVEARVGDTYRLVVDGPAGRLWRIDPRAEAVTSSVGDAVVVGERTPAPFQAAPWRSAVIYEMHVGTFVDEPGGGPGTFDSAITKLDDLAALGVTHVELMPVAEFAADYSWGYNPAHLFAVESAYGGPAAFDRFIAAAHERGIAVILDVVYNHLGPSDLDLWRFDGWVGDDDATGGVYFYSDARAETPWGHTRPDYGRAAVRDLLRDNARFWIERGVDGLRLDSTSNIRARMYGNEPIADGWRLLQEMNDDVHALGLDKKMIAEDLAGLASITDDTSAGGAGFDAQWDAGFVHPLRAALIAVDDSERDMHAVRAAIAERPGFDRIVYTESHDEVANGHARVPEEVWPGNASSDFARRRALLGIAVVMTTPGVPMMFQGQEFLEDGWFSDTDPLDWTKRATHADVWERTRDLIALRKNSAGTTRGLTGLHVNAHHVNDGAKVIAWHRWDEGGPGDDVVVVASFSHASFASYVVGVPRCGEWRVRPSGAVVDGTGAARDGMPCSAAVSLAPYEALVLSQDP